MKLYQFPRRTFLAGMIASVSAEAAFRTEGAAAPVKYAFRLGGPVFVKDEDPAVLAQAHVTLGYRAAYAPDAKLEDRERITAIVNEFAARDIVIAEVGAWVNLLDQDPVKRAENHQLVATRLALADELGALCCVDIAGSYNPKAWDGPHPDNFSEQYFEETVENVRKLIDAVRPSRTRFALEMMGWMLPSSPEEYLSLIKAVDRKAFGVHVDVCNMINSPQRIYGNAEMIRDCFRQLGPWIISCHAKDVAWVLGSQMHFQEVVPGRGELNYGVYLDEISKLGREVPLMIEHLRAPEEYLEAAEFIRTTARKQAFQF